MVSSHSSHNEHAQLTQRVLIRQRRLTAQRIPLNRTKIINLNYNTRPRRTQRRIVVVRIRQRRKLITQSTCWSSASAWTDAIEILGDGSIKAGVVVESTGCGRCVAVLGAE